MSRAPRVYYYLEEAAVPVVAKKEEAFSVSGALE